MCVYVYVWMCVYMCIYMCVCACACVYVSSCDPTRGAMATKGRNAIMKHTLRVAVPRPWRAGARATPNNLMFQGGRGWVVQNYAGRLGPDGYRHRAERRERGRTRRRILVRPY